jgi:hypothetical protein
VSEYLEGLLIRYIALIKDEEGIDFLDGAQDGWVSRSVRLSNDDLAALREFSAEADIYRARLEVNKLD